MTIIVKKISQIICPVIFIFGLYIIVHGHLSPGGGFSGGVILAGAFILQILSKGKNLPNLYKEEHGLEFLESTAQHLSGYGNNNVRYPFLFNNLQQSAAVT